MDTIRILIIPARIIITGVSMDQRQSLSVRLINTLTMPTKNAKLNPKSRLVINFEKMKIFLNFLPEKFIQINIETILHFFRLCKKYGLLCNNYTLLCFAMTI